jgi:hypothetical protein
VSSGSDSCQWIGLVEKILTPLHGLYTVVNVLFYSFYLFLGICFTSLEKPYLEMKYPQSKGDVKNLKASQLSLVGLGCYIFGEDTICVANHNFLG